MPTSSLAMWPAILHLAWEVKPHRILDIGPGHGKASVLLREYVGSPPIERIDAVEGWEPYIADFDLDALYDAVWSQDAATLTQDQLTPYDLVLMCDVIEHMGREDALALLARIHGRVIVCTPVDFFDNPEGLPWTETHRSVWQVSDFDGRIEVDASQLGGVLVRLGPQ